MSSDLNDYFKRQDLVMRKMFSDAILEPSYQPETVTAEVFHETLALAYERNWIHPTRLATAVALSDSNTRKWFFTEPAKRSTPPKPVMSYALQKLSKLIQDDVDRIEAGKPTVNNTIQKRDSDWIETGDPTVNNTIQERDRVRIIQLGEQMFAASCK